MEKEVKHATDPYPGGRCFAAGEYNTTEGQRVCMEQAVCVWPSLAVLTQRHLNVKKCWATRTLWNILVELLRILQSRNHQSLLSSTTRSTVCFSAREVVLSERKSAPQVLNSVCSLPFVFMTVRAPTKSCVAQTHLALIFPEPLSGSTAVNVFLLDWASVRLHFLCQTLRNNEAKPQIYNSKLNYLSLFWFLLWSRWTHGDVSMTHQHFSVRKNWL